MRLPSAVRFVSGDRMDLLSMRHSSWIGVGALALLTALLYLFVLDRFGPLSLVLLTLMLIFGPIFTVISFQKLQIPLLFWLATMMGLRTLIYVPTPGLPDITLDRLAMLWIVAVFVIRSVATRTKLKGPPLLQVLLLVHASYLAIGILVFENVAFNSWVKSYLMPYAAFIVAANLMSDFKWVRLALILLLLMNLYNAVTAIAEHFHINALVYPKSILDWSIGQHVPGRSRGIFLQSGVLGTIMAMLLCVQMYFLRTSRSVVFKVLLLVSLALSAMGLFFTYTRGSWLAGAVAFLAMGIIGFRAYAGWVIRLSLAAILLLGLGFINFSQDKFLKERVESEHTLVGRVNTAATAFRIWRDHPFFGIGLRGYLDEKEEYQETIRVPILGLIRRGQGFESQIHDIYLGVICEEGVVGFSLQLTIYFLIFRELIRKLHWRRRGDHFSRFLVPMFGGAFVGYLVGGIAFDYRFFSSLPGLFYFFAGMLFAYEPKDEATVTVTRPVALADLND